MPQRETIIARIPREGPVPDLELRVGYRNTGSKYVRGVHIREWWLPRSGENPIPSNRGIVIHPSELDQVIAALTEAKKLLAYTRVPWHKDTPCPRCQSPEARQARRTSPDDGSFPADYYCDLCGAVDGPLRKEPPVIDLTDDENHNWLHEVRRQRLGREQRGEDTDGKCLG